jgi:hypothetical protein
MLGFVLAAMMIISARVSCVLQRSGSTEGFEEGQQERGSARRVDAGTFAGVKPHVERDGATRPWLLLACRIRS